MKEQVCIVLNERESTKAKAAEALAERLKEFNITSSRVEIDEHIEEIILERTPTILVLDYLLGDYSTGLDIINRFNNLDDSKKPKVIFLTDEPSVPVAVEAMRSGARNYFELDHPQAVNNAAREIHSLIKSTPDKKRKTRTTQLRLKDLVAHSKASQQMIQRASTLAKKKNPIVIVNGTRGTGVSALAKALHDERDSDSFVRVVDLATLFDNPKEALGLSASSPYSLSLGNNLSIILEGLEYDDGETLELLAEEAEKIWSSRSPDSFLTICTHDAAIAKACNKLPHSELINIPELSKRTEDIPPLIQRFVSEAESLIGKKIKAFDAELISWLSSLEWPQEIKQLRAVVLDAAVASTFSKTGVKKLIEENLALWEEIQQAEEEPDEELGNEYTASKVLEACNYNYRVAAAKLGTTVRALRKALSQEG